MQTAKGLARIGDPSGLAVALVYQQWIWPLILGWRPWR